MPTLRRCGKAGCFAPGREIWLEIGFGGGEHLLARAAENPEVGFIGCEPFVNGVAKLLAGVEARGLDNVRVRADDATALIAAAPDAAFSRVYLLYPDPWPKRRQQKRRFVSERNVAALARVLKPGRRSAFRHRHRRLRRLDAAAIAGARRFSPGRRGPPTTGACPGRAGRRRATRRRRALPGGGRLI